MTLLQDVIAERDYLREENRQLKQVLKPDFKFPQEWELTGKERDILAALLSKDYVSVDYLMSALYGGEENPPGHGVLRVHVRNLRKKLNPHGIGINVTYRVGYFLDTDMRADLRARMMPRAA